MQHHALPTAGRFPVRRKRPNRPTVDNACRPSWRPSNGYRFIDLSLATSRLRDALSGKRALLVADNVWDVETLEPLAQATGTDVRVLATTQLAGLATALGAQDLSLDVLSTEAALLHLADWTGLAPDALPEEAAQLARECGYLPFALALNGAMVRDGASWTALIEALRAGELDFAEQRFVNYGYRTVERSIRASVDMLSREDATAARRYQDLSAFMGDGVIPEAAVSTLWGHRGGLEPRRAQKLLITLARKSLVRLDGEFPARRVLLHDLHRKFLTDSVEDPAALHLDLVNAYRKLCPRDWPSGPADGYFHRHLVTHLIAAGETEEVHRLLALASSTRRNAWFEVPAHDLATEDVQE